MAVASIAALGVAVVASAIDLRTQRIPNILTFGAALLGLSYHLAVGGAAGAAWAVAGWLVGALVFIVPFALRGLGGGDVKLLAARGAWLGVTDVFWLALYTGVAGGVLALLVALAHGYTGRAAQNIWLLLCHWRVSGLRALPEITIQESKAPKLAYAVPILIGTIGVIWFR
jgi:prepilin peptidase CpaA